MCGRENNHFVVPFCWIRPVFFSVRKTNSLIADDYSNYNHPTSTTFGKEVSILQTRLLSGLIPLADCGPTVSRIACVHIC